jgi:hypothetical protein
VARLPALLAGAARGESEPGLLANWNNLPSAGWTNGDAPATERLSGAIHRGGFLAGLVQRAKDTGTYEALLGVDREAGTTAQQRPLLDAQLRAAASGATGPAKAVLDTIVAWDGDYDTVDGAGTVDPGVAALEALKDAAAVRTLRSRAAREPTDEKGTSHAFDVSRAESFGLESLTAAGYRLAAADAAAALARRFGSPDPARWREPRRGYDVSVQGIADKPPLEFYDRGTWQQAVELGP